MIQSLNIVNKSQLRQSIAILVIGLGLFTLLAHYFFNPSDYLPGFELKQRVQSPFGPFGAWLAGNSFFTFGLAAFFWPLCILFYGVIVFAKQSLSFSAKRWIGLLLACIFLSAFFEILFRFHFPINRPSFGYGGWFGIQLGGSLYKYFGALGTLLVLAVLFLISMILTRNLHFSTLVQPGLIFKKVKLFLQTEDWGEKEKSLIREALLYEIADAKERGSKSVDVMRKRALQEVEKEQREEKKKSFQTGSGSANHKKLEAGIFGKSQPGKAVPKPTLDALGKKLVTQLTQYGVEGRLKSISAGPVVTTFEFEPSAGTKISKIQSLSEDLARMLSAKSIRILAPIPGRSTVGFEVSNPDRSLIGFKELLENPKLRSQQTKLPICIGLDTFGDPLIADLTTMPHLLVAGSTGSGKSVFINSLILSLIARHRAKDLRLILVDPKMVELSVYNDLPHLSCPVVIDPQNEVLGVLEALIDEMEHRFTMMQQLGARNLENFNGIIKSQSKSKYPKFAYPWQTLPFLVLIIDELADMMMVLGREAEMPITRLAQKARACGIHLVIATQRPSADVVTGLIKANFPTRIAFRVSSGIDSRTILDTSGAEELLGKGDMLFLNSQGIQRLHGAYITDEEVQNAVKMVRLEK